jgi:regulator of RNase E activity RraA
MLVKSRVSAIRKEVIEGYLKVSPATIGHYVTSGYMSQHVRPLLSDVKIAGPAFTVKIAANDSAAVHVAASLIEPGDVMVIDRGGDRAYACVGGIVALAAKARGAAGIVIDGPATDVQEIRAMGLPVFCTGLVAVTTRVFGIYGEINTTVQCGGCVVEPGDLMFADDNGVLVIKPEEAEELLRTAQAKEAGEQDTIARLMRGELLADLSGANALLEGDVASVIQKLKGK